jgi:hypothetical protein
VPNLDHFFAGNCFRNSTALAVWGRRRRVHSTAPVVGLHRCGREFPSPARSRLSKHTLYAWKEFEMEGPAGLLDRPRAGATDSGARAVALPRTGATCVGLDP